MNQNKPKPFDGAALRQKVMDLLKAPPLMNPSVGNQKPLEVWQSAGPIDLDFLDFITFIEED